MTKIPELLVASNNAGKIREIMYALREISFRVLPLKEAGIQISPEENGASYLGNALIKARAAAEHWQGWILADDSGLEVDALGGRPGIHSSRFAGENATDAENNAKLIEALKDVPEMKRTARFRCVAVLLYSESEQTFTAEGVCEGIILQTPCGKNGFGFDPLFFLPSLHRTMAELTFEEKMQVSHRARALKNLKEKINLTL